MGESAGFTLALTARYMRGELTRRELRRWVTDRYYLYKTNKEGRDAYRDGK